MIIYFFKASESKFKFCSSSNKGFGKISTIGNKIKLEVSIIYLEILFLLLRDMYYFNIINSLERYINSSSSF